MKHRSIVVTGGGTAGHIYPVLEIVSLLKKRRPTDVLYIGGKGNLEESLVGKQIPFKGISVGKLRRQITLLHLRDAVRIATGLVGARSILKKIKPAIVFAKGGYVSLPVIIAAKRYNIPVVMHESDVVMGLANRIGIKVAQKICVGFPVHYYPKPIQQKLVYTGIPVRPGFFERPTIKDRQLFGLKKNLPVTIIIGGSQGAAAINDAIMPILPILLRQSQVIHLTGTDHIDRFTKIKKELPKEFSENYHPFDFLKNGMESAVRVSDIAISRSGSTIVELAAASVPMILIPLPSAAGDHQVKNAEVFTKSGAAVTIRQHNLTPERLLRTFTTIINDPSRLKMMSNNASKLADRDSVDKVVRVIEEVLHG